MQKGNSCRNHYPKSVNEYVFQARNAPLYQDHLEALKGLESRISDDAIYSVFVDAAQVKKQPFKTLCHSTA